MIYTLKTSLLKNPGHSKMVQFGSKMLLFTRLPRVALGWILEQNVWPGIPVKKWYGCAWKEREKDTEWRLERQTWSEEGKYITALFTSRNLVGSRNGLRKTIFKMSDTRDNNGQHIMWPILVVCMVMHFLPKCIRIAKLAMKINGVRSHILDKLYF